MDLPSLPRQLRQHLGHFPHLGLQLRVRLGSQGEIMAVLAPTDEASAALPDGLLETVLADSELLAAVLTYHVVAGELVAQDVVSRTSVATLNGASVSVVAGSAVRIDEATVVAADVRATNGIIHVVDQVLIPPME